MYGIELEFDWLHFPFICFLLIFHVCTSWPHTRFWSCFERHDTVLYVLSAKFGFVHGRGSVNIYGWISLDSEKAMAAHSSTLAWKIPWAEGAAVHGVARSRTWLSDFTFHLHALEKEMATYSSTLAGRIPGSAEPGGLLSMGSHRVGHDWSDAAAAV